MTFVKQNLQNSITGSRGCEIEFLERIELFA